MKISKVERRELAKRAASRTLRAEDARRARCILLLADGHTWAEIRDKLRCTDGFIACWSKRFASERLSGLYSRHLGSRPSKLTASLEARILERTRQSPPDGATHWSTRRLASALGTHHMMVARVWAKHGLKPHRLERYMASNDPQFEAKAADVIGLYLNPPAHAAVFCLDEKSAIQALDRLDPVLPLSPGRAERHGFEYTGMARSPCTPPSTPRPEKYWARPPRTTPPPSSSPSSLSSLPTNPGIKRST